MSDQVNANNVGTYLKDLLRKQSLSMRKLSEMTDIDVATISRIMNGKRKATPEHLQKFAESLGVPATELFIAAGYPIDQQLISPRSDIHSSIDSIQRTLESSELYNSAFSTEDVNQHLVNYQQYSQTVEGKETILNDFENKLTNTGSIGPFINQLKDMFEKYRLKRGTPTELAIIGGALIYFIISVDAIPDYIFPIGYLDDAIALKLTLHRLSTKV